MKAGSFFKVKIKQNGKNDEKQRTQAISLGRGLGVGPFNSDGLQRGLWHVE